MTPQAMLSPWSPHRGRRGKTSASGESRTDAATRWQPGPGSCGGPSTVESRGKTFKTRSEAEAFRGELMLRQAACASHSTRRPPSRRRGPRRLAEPRSTTGPAAGLANSGPSGSRVLEESAVEALTRFLPLVSTSRPSRRQRTYGLTSLIAGSRGSFDTTTLTSDGWMSRCTRWSRSTGTCLPGSTRSSAVASRGSSSLLRPRAGTARSLGPACVGHVELDILDRDPWPPTPTGRQHRKASSATQGRRRAGAARASHDGASPRRHRHSSTWQSHVPGDDRRRLLRRPAALRGRDAATAGAHPSAVGLGSHRRRPRPTRPSTSRANRRPASAPCPIPPVLVEILNDWLEGHDFASDELIFRTRNRRRPTASNWSRAWHRALRSIGHPPLRVYDCRHAAATTWLKGAYRSARSRAASATASRRSCRPTSVRWRPMRSLPTRESTSCSTTSAPLASQ